LNWQAGCRVCRHHHLSSLCDPTPQNRRVQIDLSTETRNHGLNRLQEARVGVDNGAGENDLKRLQRKFQATKASYINVDVKERFMQSEWGYVAVAGLARRSSSIGVRE